MSQGIYDNKYRMPAEVGPTYLEQNTAKFQDGYTQSAALKTTPKRRWLLTEPIRLPTPNLYGREPWAAVFQGLEETTMIPQRWPIDNTEKPFPPQEFGNNDRLSLGPGLPQSENLSSLGYPANFNSTSLNPPQTVHQSGSFPLGSYEEGSDVESSDSHNGNWAP